MNKIKYVLFLSVFTVLVFAKQINHSVKKDIVVNSMNNRSAVMNVDSSILPENREEIDIWVDDFEVDLGWVTGSGWSWTEEDSNSPTHSMVSPNDATTINGSWNLVSPPIDLPALGEGETMNFSFFLNVDMPDSDGDNDNGLEDYYTVSIQDTDALAWQSSSVDSYDGDSWWCAEEGVGANGGYLDSWIQFLDTPSFTVPAMGMMSADMMWTIEDPAGAVIAGSCTDGWDAANVRISSDGGQTWELLNGSDPYDFQCGYGWIWNSDEYDIGGSLNSLAAGWGGDSNGWNNITFDLSAYSGQDVIVRFAFGSDPAYCTLDDASITGLHVDNIVVSGALDCTPENNCDVSVAGEVWVDQFYDYFDDGTTYDPRPGSNGWEEYVAGYPFNGNVFLDISSFSEKTVIFRVQSRYDDNDDGGQGAGLFIDDFRVYKVSGGNYPAPWDLAGEGLGNEAALTWADMNASGTTNYQFDNDAFSNGIQMSSVGSTAFAGTEITLAGTSNVSTVSIFNIGNPGDETTIAGFGTNGTLYSNDPLYTEDVVLANSGWNDFQVNWDFNNNYIIAHEFTYIDSVTGAGTLAALDETASPSVASKVLFSGGAWDDWSTAGAAIGDGEWGIRATVSFDGANVTYNVYRDGAPIASGLGNNSYSDTDVVNNVTYVYAVSATYSDGEESGLSDTVEVTPQAQTVHEEYYDDGSAEESFNAGSGNFTAVKYSAIDEGEGVVRFKWYQMEDGGAFYLKMYEDVNGAPGSEFYSQVIAGGLSQGWNTRDLSSETLTLSGDFWIGTKEFSSTSPFGLDTTSDMGMSYSRVGSTGDWTSIPGNLMVRVYLDCGLNCEDGGEPSCTAGDVNTDGIINVLDIVSTVAFVMNTQSPSDDQECAADFNGDGIINVLDIVSIVGVITGG